MISFTGKGLRRSRCLTLSKFRDPQLEPLAVLSLWTAGPVSPEAQGVEPAVQEPIHTVLSHLGMGFGQESEKGWETWNHLLPIVIQNNLQDA